MAKDCSDYVLYSDFDRTFKMNSEDGVLKNINAVKNFINAGGSFAFATGRGEDYFADLAPYQSEIVNAPMIYYNGGYVFDTKRNNVINYELYDSVFIRDFLKSVVKKIPQMNINVHVDGRKIMHNPDIDSIKEQMWIKCILFYEPSVISEIRIESEAVLSNFIDITQSSDRCLEFLPKGVSKGKALDLIRDYYRDILGKNIKLFAIGDYENDLNMLKHADISATPQNGEIILKEIADYTVCHCDDGAVADFIDRIMN